MTFYRIFLLAILMACTSSCYKETIEFECQREVYDLIMSTDIYETILESRDSVITVEGIDLELFYNGIPVEIKKIRTRGKSALRYRRKSFSVFLDHSILTHNHSEKEIKRLDHFKLLSMSMDYTYIENRIGLGILAEAEVMPLLYRYVELRINGETQGIYMLLEDPEEYCKEKGSEFVIRRGYNHHMMDTEFEPGLYQIPMERYEDRFLEVYDNLAILQGEALYNMINARINLNQYFRKMGIDYLLKNGDSTDEVYFYSTILNDNIRYLVLPWDYDDLFSTKPHEVGRTWGRGTVFGVRPYPTLQDIYDEIGDKLIYSIEDDLDYAIAMDSFLYAQYETTLINMFEKIDDSFIASLFDQIEKELDPYYFNIELTRQSEYDLDSTNLDLWKSNMMEKKAFLEDRLQAMKNQLNQP